MFCARLCFAVSNNFEVRDENRRASTKNFLHGSEINVQTFVKPRFFTFSLAVFAPLKSAREHVCVHVRNERGSLDSRGASQKSVFKVTALPERRRVEEKVLGRCRRKLHDAATQTAGTPTTAVDPRQHPARRRAQHRISDAVVLDKCQRRSQNVSQSARDSRVRLQLPRWYLQTALNVTSETFSSIEIRFKPKIMQRSVSLALGWLFMTR